MKNPDYKITAQNGCKVVYGSLPVREALGLLQTWPVDWLFDPELARAVNASFVIGSRDDLNQWRQELGMELLAGEE